MPQIKIVVPSAGRWDSVLTDVDNMILCVPKNEVEKYKKFNDCEIIGHEPLKNLAAKRNFILNKFGEVFQLDDDCQSFERVYISKNQKMSPSATYKQVQELYYQAKAIDAKLFGFSEDPSPIHYNPYKPFMLKGMSGGGAYGILENSGLYFTELTTACDSHFVNLLNAFKNRYCLVDTRFVFRHVDTFKGNGGQALKRTLETEKQDCLYLRSIFGEAVELRKNDKKGAKQNHQYQRKIKVKW